MEQLKNYRVQAWSVNGLMVSLEPIAQATKSFVAAGLISTGVVSATVNFNLASVVSTIPEIQLNEVITQANAFDRTNQIGRQIDQKIANFMSLDYSDLSEEQLVRAQRAVEASAARRLVKA